MAGNGLEFEQQFVLLSRELHDAEATERSGAGDDVDRSDRQRYVEALRNELEALKAAHPQRRNDLPELRKRAEDIPADDDSAGAVPRPGALAVVIGHSPQGDMGNNGVVPPFPAEPRTARSEYYWNRDVAERVKALGIERGFDVEVFHRWKSGARFIPEAYEPVRGWGPEASVEIHFNGSDPPARGTETLHLQGVQHSAQWATALQIRQVELYGRSKADKSDRGLKPRASGDRGSLSLRQIHPSALIEPFFGDSPADAALGVAKKQELAGAIVDAFADFSQYRPVSAAAPVADMADDDAGSPGVPATEAFTALAKLYATTQIDFPTLRDISFAQWAHESDFGRSELAREHRNFAGMKWRDAMAPLASRERYRPAHDPDGRDYCGFESLLKFIAGYWFRLDLPSLPYSSRNGGWRRHADSPDIFIDFIGPIWAPRGGSNSPFNARYEEKVRKRYRQLKAANLLPSQVASA